jgi:hypothetical protein
VTATARVPTEIQACRSTGDTCYRVTAGGRVQFEAAAQPEAVRGTPRALARPPQAQLGFLDAHRPADAGLDGPRAGRVSVLILRDGLSQAPHIRDGWAGARWTCSQFVGRIR